MNFDNILNIRNKTRIVVIVDNDEVIFYDKITEETIYEDHPISLLYDLLKSYNFYAKGA